MSDFDTMVDYLESHPELWGSCIDEDGEFGQMVAAILADSENDKLGRIRDLHYDFITKTAQYAIESQWHGFWGNIKRAAGLVEPTPWSAAA